MSNPYVGEIRMFAGTFAPDGWLLCQGQLLSIQDFDTLFNLIGFTYGGDGQETFALPDLASRIPLGRSSRRPLGTQGGVETVTLGLNQLANHTHAVQASTTAGTSRSAAGAVPAASGKTPYTQTGDAVAMASGAVQASGGGQPHDNMPPHLGMNFIISLYGVYPSPT